MSKKHTEAVRTKRSLAEIGAETGIALSEHDLSKVAGGVTLQDFHFTMKVTKASPSLM